MERSKTVDIDVPVLARLSHFVPLHNCGIVLKASIVRSSIEILFEIRLCLIRLRH